MLLLAVDTATPSGSLAVLRDGRLAGVVFTATEEAYSSRLFRQWEFLLKELRLEMRAFDVFAVCAGPGSFTGLRVGLAAVKGWAEVFGKPVVAVSGLEAVAAQAGNRESLLAPVLDARRGQIYAAIYRREGEGLALEGEEQVSTAAEFLASLPSRTGRRPVQFITPTPEILQRALADTGIFASGSAGSVESASNVLAPVIGALAAWRARRGEFTDALRLDANYIRRSDAELLWRNR